MKIPFLLILFLISVYAAADQPQTQSRPAGSPSVFHHPTGLEFRYPAGWAIRENSIGEMELVPPDQQKNEKGVTEGFLLWGIGGNFAGPVDTSLSGYLNSLLTKMAPFLKQDGDPQRFDADAGPAMTVSWAGVTDDGTNITAKTFSVVHGPFAFVLVMLGSRERMAVREAAIRELFQSFQFKDAARDPALIGGWQSPAVQTQAAGDSGIRMKLGADGAFELREPSGNAGGEDRISGIWYAADGKICFVYPESFFLNFRYQLEGGPGARKLTLTHSSGAVQTLIEIPEEAKKNP